jgi:hypothetical protein
MTDRRHEERERTRREREGDELRQDERERRSEERDGKRGGVRREWRSPLLRHIAPGRLRTPGGWTPPFGPVLTNVREASEGEELSS